MAFRKPIGEDPRFKKASKFREDLEREFPRLRELSTAHQQAELTDLHLARFRQFVPLRVKQALEQEDEVLAEMVLALVEDKRELDPYEMLELLEPFIGKQESVSFVTETFQFIHALQQNKVSPPSVQEQVKPMTEQVKSQRQRSPSSRTAQTSPPPSRQRSPRRTSNRSKERRRREDDNTRCSSNHHRSRSPDQRRHRRTRRH